MHPVCVVRSRVAISKLIDATTPGESRSNLAPALQTPKQLGPSLTPTRAVLHRVACWQFFPRLNFVEYPNLLRWSWGFQHQLNSRTVLFVFGAFHLIRRCLYTVVCVLVLLAVHRQTLGFPKSYFFVYLAALCLDLSFYQWHRGLSQTEIKRESHAHLWGTIKLYYRERHTW